VEQGKAENLGCVLLENTHFGKLLEVSFGILLLDLQANELLEGNS